MTVSGIVEAFKGYHLWFKVARLDFFEGIPPEFEH